MSRAHRAANIIGFLIGLFVAGLVGWSVLVAQRAAIEQCAPGCDVRGLVVTHAASVVTFTIGPVPVGAGVLAIVGLWIVQAVRAGRWRAMSERA